LSAVTGELCRALNVAVQVVPMSDGPVATRLLTSEGWLDFQDYFVRRACEPAVREVAFDGAAAAQPAAGALAALKSDQLKAIVICPSNPFVSIDPILAVPGMRSAIRQAGVLVVAVTPIPGGVAVKGPAAKMMRELGYEASARSLLERYQGLVDVLVVDESDPPLPTRLGMTVIPAPTLMRNIDDRMRLARKVLDAARVMPGSRS
jgi:LPPG:FO 2-phospho-L-lactate transferase